MHRAIRDTEDHVDEMTELLRSPGDDSSSNGQEVNLFQFDLSVCVWLLKLNVILSVWIIIIIINQRPNIAAVPDVAIIQVSEYLIFVTDVIFVQQKSLLNFDLITVFKNNWSTIFFVIRRQQEVRLIKIRQDRQIGDNRVKIITKSSDRCRMVMRKYLNTVRYIIFNIDYYLRKLFQARVMW